MKINNHSLDNKYFIFFFNIKLLEMKINIHSLHNKYFLIKVIGNENQHSHFD